MTKCHCPYCEYDWESRVERPKECPRCHGRLDRPKRKHTDPPIAPPAAQPTAPLPPPPPPEAPPAEPQEAMFDTAPSIEPPAPLPAIVVDRPALLMHFAQWISSKSLLLKHEDLKNSFRDELYAHQAEIAETYGLKYTPGTNLNVVSLSALLLLDLKTDPKHAHNMTLISAISDLENVEATRRRGRK